MKKKNKSKFTFKQNVRLIFRGLKVFSSFPKPLLLSKTVFCIFNAAVPFINIYFSAQILNELAGTRNPDRLAVLVSVTIGLNLVFMLMRSAVSRWTAHCDTATWISMYKVYSDKLLSMDYIDIEDPKVQQEVSEIRQHQNGMGFGLPRLIQTYEGIATGLIQILMSVAMAFSLFTLKTPRGSSLAWLDSLFTIFAVITVLLCSVLVAPYLSMTGQKIWSKASSSNNKANRIFHFYFTEMTSNNDRAKDIRIYDQKRLIDRGADAALATVDEFIKYSRYNARYSAFSTAVSYLSNGLIYLYVALKAFAGAFGVGSIIQYVGAISQFSNGFASVLTNIGTMFNNNVFLEKSLHFLDIPNKKYQGTLSVEKRDDNDYEIEFHNVSFKYPGASGYALKDLNLKLKIGRRIAVVGMNGSGKTTMIKLLCRLYDPTEGLITLNGLDIKKYNYDEYMAIFSVVFQDFRLLPFTLGQNVASSIKYDDQRVLSSLDKAGLSTRLSGMPQGLDSYLYKNFEDDGVEISGGEAQKIALARALYKEAPFIILDEPTAALDPIAEYEIYSRFNEIAGTKTVIYISHRLSSCRFCDEITVFDDGRLIQQGSHEALLADKSGKYCELWNAQAQYYTENKTEPSSLG